MCTYAVEKYEMGKPVLVEDRRRFICGEEKALSNLCFYLVFPTDHQYDILEKLEKLLFGVLHEIPNCCCFQEKYWDE